ncbi:MAG: hypothetical protein Q9208_007440 [Pyrenodesmia sp. 3 TL-2023]
MSSAADYDPTATIVTVSSTEDERAIQPSDNVSPSDKNLLASLVRRLKPSIVRRLDSTNPGTEPTIRKVNSTRNVETEGQDFISLATKPTIRLENSIRNVETEGKDFIDLATKPTIRLENSIRNVKTENQRSHAEKLEIFRSGKEFRNRTLKDKGSWSYDWRIALSDLEKHWDPNASNTPSPTTTVELSAKIHIPRNIRADKIEPTSQWTKVSFHDYVVQLAHSTVNRLVARQLYQKDETHTDVVADLLERAFATRSAKYVITVEASNIALKFFFRAGKSARGRDLFRRLQELQRNIHPSTYNIMLEAAADQKDLFTFTALLKAMILHGVRPNSCTWLLLSRAASGEEVPIMIIDKLIQKMAMQDPDIMKNAASSILPQVATEYLKSGKDPQYLVDFLGSSFKPEWFSGIACQKVIDQVGVYHSTPQALMILQKFRDRGYRPTAGMLLLLLRQCKWLRAHDLATDILRLFRTEYVIQPTEQIYGVLFAQAWRSRLYNCCKVIWIHACVTGHTSFHMQEHVKKSLSIERSLKFSSHSRGRTWDETAGKVIVGCDPVYSDSRKKWDLLSSWKPAQENYYDRDKFLRTARSMLASDLGLSQHYSIKEPLDELFSRALAKDRQWALGKALKEVPIECKCSQIIEPSLISKITKRAISNQEDAFQAQQDAESRVSARESVVRDGRCWMSPEMRSRPCSCPEYVKEGLSTSSDARLLSIQRLDASSFTESTCTT